MNAPGSPSSALQMRYFCAAGVSEGDLPLLPGGEARAAAAAQPGGDHRVADLLAGHGGERPGRGGEAAGGQRRVQGGRIDQAAVVEHHPGLPGEERGVGDQGHVLEARRGARRSGRTGSGCAGRP